MELAIVVAGRSWLEISLWKTRKGRKKEKEHTRKKRDGIRTAELNRRDQVTATVPGPVPFEKSGTEVDYQVAAPTGSSTPKLHRATIAQPRVRMEGWRQERLGSRAGTHRGEEKNKNILKERKKKKKNMLDTHRPSWKALNGDLSLADIKMQDPQPTAKRRLMLVLLRTFGWLIGIVLIILIVTGFVLTNLPKISADVSG